MCRWIFASIAIALVAVVAAGCASYRSSGVVARRLVVACDAHHLDAWQSVRCACGLPADGWNERGELVLPDPRIYRITWDYDAWELDVQVDRENPAVAYVTPRPTAERGLASIGCIARHPDGIHIYRGTHTFYVE